MTRALIIWNPCAGKASTDEAQEVRQQLEAIPTIEIVEAESNRQARVLAERARRHDFQVVVAAGGDGTVNAVANGLYRGALPARKSPIVMGVLPIGTANDFALTLGLPDDLQQAHEVLRNGTPRDLDLIEIATSGEPACYANVAAGGNSDRVTEALTDEIKQTWGPLCYLRGAIGVLADLEAYQVEVQFDDESPLRLPVWNVIVANGRTNAGHLPLAPRANPEDGLMDVILIKEGTGFDLASVAANFILQTYLECDQVEYRQVHKLRITSDPQLRFSIDGEPIDDQPVVFRSLHQFLPMLVGPDYTPSPQTNGDDTATARGPNG
ncbi:MAG: diacylglycerol kinase [Pirellulaceae bacterium]|nr:MAG: diacylglycerol kinase [Pirellulaceae bacterium]